MSGWDGDTAVSMKVGAAVMVVGIVEDYIVGEGVQEMGRLGSRTEDLVVVDVRMSFVVVVSERMEDEASSFLLADMVVVRIVEASEGWNLAADMEGIRSQDVTKLSGIVVVVR